MPNTLPTPGQESELLALINHPQADHLAAAACRGRSPDDYHPEIGLPAGDALALCCHCPARLACLALALRLEDAEARYGWYGGLSPAERHDLAESLALTSSSRPLGDPADEAAELRAQGKTVGEIAQALGRSRRTVQRYLNGAA